MYNWARTVKLCEKSQIVHPKDEDELIQILRHRLPHQRIKVRGAGMSCLGIGALDSSTDLLLDLSSFSGLIEIGTNEATFGASTPLQDVSDILIRRGRQITACAGVLLTQTLAGAIATGTHGQGFRNGGLYDSVKRLRTVLANASVVEYSIDDPCQDNFNAFRLHLGSLGILTHITLYTEPLRTYKLVKAVTTFEDLYENYLEWNETSSHCKAWWFPTTDHVQVWRSFKPSQLEEEYYNRNGGNIIEIPSSSSSTNNLSFLETIDHLVEKMDEDTKSHGGEKVKEPDPFNEHNARFRTVNRFRSLENILGNMYQLWCKGVPAPQINCELAIPISELQPALQSLRKYILESKRELHYPFILRATGSSNAWLSPSYGQRVVYIGFLVYLSEEDYSASEESLQVLKEVERILGKHGAIPHYGKFMSMSQYNFTKLLPKWNDFLNLRKKIDPNGVFLNSFLKQLFGFTTPQPSLSFLNHQNQPRFISKL